MSDDFMRDEGGGTFDPFRPGGSESPPSTSESKQRKYKLPPRTDEEKDEPLEVPEKFESNSSSGGQGASRGERYVAEVQSQELVFYPVTSVTYRGSSSSEFEAHEPVVRAFDPGVLQDVEYVPPQVLEQMEGRYIYLLLDTASLRKWLDDTFQAGASSSQRVHDVSVQMTGKPYEDIKKKPFVVSRVFVVQSGRYQEAEISKVRQFAKEAKFPPPDHGHDAIRLSVYDDQLIWAFGSPFPLTEEQIAKLEEVDWPEFSKVAVGPNVGVKMGDAPGLRIVAQHEPGVMAPAVGIYTSGIPLVDPLLVLKNLGSKYGVACDDVHAHLGRFVNQSDKVLQYKKYEAALGVLPLFKNRKAVPGAVSTLEREISDFDEAHEKLATAAEAAAESLMNWLQSAPIKFIEELVWDCEDDPELRAYRGYSAVYLGVLPRMWETERGKSYMGAQLDELEKSEAPSRGAPKVLVDLVLPSDKKSSDTFVGVAQSLSGVVAGAWGAFCPAIVKRAILQASQGYVVAGQSFGTPFLAIQRASAQLNVALGDTLLSVEMKATSVHTHLGATESLLTRGKGLELGVELSTLKVETSTASAVGAAATKLTGMLEALNAVLAVGAVREALAKEKRDNVATAADTLRLVKSVVSISESYTTLRGVSQIASRRNALKLAGRLALVGAAVDVLASSADALHNFKTGDKDAAAGDIAAATGAGMVIAGLLLASNPAGWVVAGILLGAAGSAWASSHEDTPYDKLFNHSPFGKSSLMDELEAEDPAWTLTTTNYSRWSRETQVGIETFLGAAQQLQFAFSVKGASPSSPVTACDAAFEILPKELLVDSTFHIEYDITYAAPGPPGGEELRVTGYLWLLNIAKEPFLADYPDGPEATGTNFKMSQVVSLQSGVIKVNLRPTIEPKTQDNKVMQPFNVTLNVRLDVHGDAYERFEGDRPGAWGNRGDEASLAVPTTEAGVRWVEVKMVGRDWIDEGVSFHWTTLA